MTAPSATSSASPVARVAALLAGVLVALVALLTSLGTVVFSFAGMGIASWAQRRKGRVLSAGGTWVAATCGVAVVMLLGAGVGFSLAPRGTWQEVRRTMDSTSANSPPPTTPAWLERMAPGTAARAAKMNGKPSASFNVGMLLWGVAFFVMFLSGFVGSLGWATGMLLGYATKGRWPGTQPLPDVTYAHTV